MDFIFVLLLGIISCHLCSTVIIISFDSNQNNFALHKKLQHTGSTNSEHPLKLVEWQKKEICEDILRSSFIAALNVHYLDKVQHAIAFKESMLSSYQLHYFEKTEGDTLHIYSKYVVAEQGITFFTGGETVETVEAFPCAAQYGLSGNKLFTEIFISDGFLERTFAVSIRTKSQDIMYIGLVELSPERVKFESQLKLESFYEECNGVKAAEPLTIKEDAEVDKEAVDEPKTPHAVKDERENLTDQRKTKDSTINEPFGDLWSDDLTRLCAAILEVQFADYDNFNIHEVHIKHETFETAKLTYYRLESRADNTVRGIICRGLIAVKFKPDIIVQRCLIRSNRDPDAVFVLRDADLTFPRASRKSKSQASSSKMKTARFLKNTRNPVDGEPVNLVLESYMKKVPILMNVSRNVEIPLFPTPKKYSEQIRFTRQKINRP